MLSLQRKATGKEVYFISMYKYQRTTTTRYVYMCHRCSCGVSVCVCVHAITWSTPVVHTIIVL